MSTANESCDTTSQMSLFGETCENSQPLRLPPYLPTPNANEQVSERYTLETSYRHAAEGRQVHLAQVVRDARLTSSPQAIPASHSHSPGSDWARRMTGIYGRRLLGSSESFGPVGSLVRTLLGTSTWGSMTCYLTWKRSATPQGRLLFRLVPSTPRTAGIGSGLWGTPTSRDHKDTGNMENVPVNGLLGRQDLTTEPGLWPTPDVPNGGRGIPKDAERRGNSIYTADGRKVQEGLANAVKMWPTPRAEFDSGRHRGQPDTLHSAVKLLPTAQARDWKGAQGRAYKGESMDLPATVSVAGLKLNSAWVGRMMGYPDNWLILDGEATP